MGLLSKLCVQNQKQIYFKVIQYPAASWKLQVLKTLPFVHGKMLSLLPHLCWERKQNEACLSRVRWFHSLPIRVCFMGFCEGLFWVMKMWFKVYCFTDTVSPNHEINTVPCYIEKDISSLVNSRSYLSQSSHLKFFVVCVYTYTYTHIHRRENERQRKARLDYFAL